MSSNYSVVFIGGTGRCGTNVLKDLLSLHPDVCSHPFEYRFIIDPDGLMDFYISVTNIWSPYLIDKKISRLENFLKKLSIRSECGSYKNFELSKHFSNYDEEVDKLINHLTDFKYNAYYYGLAKNREMFFSRKGRLELKEIIGTFLNALIKTYLEENSKKIYVEDNTHNILFSKYLLDFFPNSKLICMNRYPIDVISSLSKQSWAPTDVIQSTIYYSSIVSEWNKIKLNLNSDAYMEVDLYELVEDKRVILDKILEFIDVSKNELLYSFDLSKSNKNRYLDEITYDELIRVKKILEEHGIKY